MPTHGPAPLRPMAASLFAVLAIGVSGEGSASAQPAWSFQAQEIAADLGVGYAVSIVDVNHDGQQDIVVVDKERVVAYLADDWAAEVLLEKQTRPDNVCLAPHDIDGDGLVDFALGADWRPFDTQSGGTIQWIGRGGAGLSFELFPIAEEPTVHRMRWADTDGDGASELIVVPLMGRGTTRPLWNERPLRVLAFRVPADPRRDPWPVEVINEELHVAHNFWPSDIDQDGRSEIVITSFEGVSVLKRTDEGTWQRRLIGSGNQATSPDRGASEVKLGRLAGGQPYLATIEPWHGFQVVVYTPPDLGAGKEQLWRRTVIDEGLKWGHAVWCANLDADADLELVIGVRDELDAQHRCGVRIYDPENAGEGWPMQAIDPGGVAVEDLAVADLNGDQRSDIVAAGRQTHNLRIYWNEGKRE